MERDLLMKKLQLLDQTLMLRLILIMDTAMDITEDTMERDLLMNLQLLAQILMLMLMLGMDIMVTDMDMDTMVMDTGERSKLAALFNQMTSIFLKMHSRFW